MSMDYVSWVLPDPLARIVVEYDNDTYRFVERKTRELNISCDVNFVSKYVDALQHRESGECRCNKYNDPEEATGRIMMTNGGWGSVVRCRHGNFFEDRVWDNTWVSIAEAELCVIPDSIAEKDESCRASDFALWLLRRHGEK